MLALGVQQWIAKMIGDYPTVVLGVAITAAGLAGVLAVCAWVLFGVEQRLQGYFRPALGSFAYKSIEF